MNKKILLGLIILGVIFVGSATYALFNENILLDVTADVQANDASPSNNQPTIQDSQANNIANGENSNLSFNNMANAVLNEMGVVNDDGEQKVVKEVSRVTANDRIYVFYDDSSIIFINDAVTSQFKNVLIYDNETIDSGYVMCADCANYIPIGKVSGLVPEKYLCKCPDEHPKSVKDVPFVYTEESVLEKIKLDENSDKMPNDNSNVDYAKLDDGNTNSSSTPERFYFDEDTFKESDFDSDFVPEFSPYDYNPFHPPTYQGMELYPEPKPMFFFNPDYLDE